MLPLVKIITTIGPSSETKEKVKGLIEAGVNVFRFNLKHNTLKWHKRKISLVRRISKKLEKPIGILADIEGGELRTGKFVREKVLELKEGEWVIFAKKDKKDIYKVIPVPRIEEFFNLALNQKVFIDDGKFEFQIKKFEKDKRKVYAQVLSGGVLKERKTINLPNFRPKSKINLKTNLAALRFCSNLKVDYIGLSFIRSQNEVLEYKKFFRKEKCQPWLISKIETKEALENFDDILEVSDGIIVARGDLGVEIPLEKVPFYQKIIIRKCLIKGKPVIVATHLLESMIENPRPTRAEVSDVANTLYDLADGFLLSAETAYGQYPELSVKTLRKISSFTENQKPEKLDLPFEIKTQTQAVCFGAFNLYKSEFCQKQNIKAFLLLSHRGTTAKALSRLRPYLPIFVITDDKPLVSKLTTIFGIYPFYLKFKNIYQKKGTKEIERILRFIKKKTFLKKGDKIILIFGEDWGTIPGRTSIMRVQEVV